MKKIFFLISFISILTLINGCDKQNEINNEFNGTTNSINILTYSNPNNKGGTTQILDFPNMESFRNKVLELENAIKENDENFTNKYSYLNEEEINQMDSITGFNYYQPLLDFNQSIGFNSLIDDYIEAENYWLHQEVLQKQFDPDIKFRYLKESELALFNDDWSVKIGGKIYVHKLDGKMEITSGNIGTLISISPYDKISDINLNQFNDINIHYNDISSTPYCTSQYIQNVEYSLIDNNPKRQMKCKIRMTNNDFWTGTELYVKTKSLKKTWYGLWINWRSNIKAGLKGGFQINSIYGLVDNCTNNSFCNENTNQNSSNNSSSINYSIGLNPNLYVIKVSKQGLQGVHRSNNTTLYQYFYQ